MSVTIPKIPKTKAWEFEFKLTHRNEATGREVPLRSATVRAWLSLTEGGEPITDGHVYTTTERTAKPGVYFVVAPVEDIASDLESLDQGAFVYEVCERNGDRDARKLVVEDVSDMIPL